MGRKKIEIKPLTDERNRNVTFLKRKAGLMKKAWELSVLCAADVSIIIFSAAGKPYEFSSKDLDLEIDRYTNYEGMIERRRAAEFAAMAADDDDDDEDEDDMPRRGSVSKGGAAAGQVKPSKSLKGKEVFKQRSSGGGHGSGRSKHRHDRDRGREDKRGFIDGILDNSSPSTHSGSSRSMGSRERDDRDLRDRRQDDMSMHYAMNMHQNANAGSGSMNYQPMSSSNHVGNVPTLSSNAWSFRQWENTPATKFLQPSSNGYNGNTSSAGGGNNYYGNNGGGNYGGSQPASSGGSGSSGGGGGGQWDQNILSRYAEFQLQQNHQRQQRALLERQRQQLAELGVPVEEKSLLDDIFGGSNNANGTGPGSVPYPEGQTPGAGGEFIWPSVNKRSHSLPHIPSNQDDELVWAQMQAQQQGDDMTFASPGSGDFGERGDKRRMRSDARDSDGHPDKRARFDDQDTRRASVW